MMWIVLIVVKGEEENPTQKFNLNNINEHVVEGSLSSRSL